MSNDIEMVIKEIESDILKKFGSKNSIEKYKCEEIGQGKGFLSKIIHLSITWKEDSTDDLPDKLIVKIPSRSQYDNIEQQTKF